MATGFKQFIVYSKVTIMVAALFAVILFVFMNRNYETSFWAGKTYEDVPTMWLMLLTALSSVLIFWLLTKVRRVWKEVSEVRAQKLQATRDAETEKRLKDLEKKKEAGDEAGGVAGGGEKSQS